MNYENLSLVELKQAAKGRKIKQYYIMKRRQLIQLLSMNELPKELKIEKLTIQELREQARVKGLRGFWTLRREQLVEMLYPKFHQGNVHQATSYKNEKDEGDTNKHNHPQQHSAEDIGIQDLENRLNNMNMNF